ncbi:MAG: hypothetical protein LRZ85_03060 [Alphaproteobacteria bacterium]|nr:hypothetical protein [Alphaproteobacteria bacterium]MCD8526167.1 hypothetical protein [Alphaproteobacteria bacterium]
MSTDLVGAALMAAPAISTLYCARTAFNSAVSKTARVVGGLSAAVTGTIGGWFLVAASQSHDPSGVGMVGMVLLPALAAISVPAATYCLGSANEASRQAQLNNDRA